MKSEVVVVAISGDSAALEPVLVEVQATLTDLLASADEQQAAVVAGDRVRLETVTSLQERLSSRLERAELKRLEHLGGTPLATARVRYKCGGDPREPDTYALGLLAGNAVHALGLEALPMALGDSRGGVCRLLDCSQRRARPRHRVHARGLLP